MEDYCPKGYDLLSDGSGWIKKDSKPKNKPIKANGYKPKKKQPKAKRLGTRYKIFKR